MLYLCLNLGHVPGITKLRIVAQASITNTTTYKEKWVYYSNHLAEILILIIFKSNILSNKNM